MDFCKTFGIQNVLCPSHLIELALGLSWLGFLHSLLYPGYKLFFVPFRFRRRRRQKCGSEQKHSRNFSKAHRFTGGCNATTLILPLDDASES